MRTTVELHFPVVKVESSKGRGVNIKIDCGVIPLSELEVVVFLVVARKDGGNGLVLALEGDADKAGQGVLFLFGADLFGGVGKGVAGGEGVVDEVTDTLGEGADSSQFVERAETADMLEGFCGEVLDVQFARCFCHDGVHGWKLDVGCKRKVR